MSQSLTWSFTLNNPLPPDVKNLQEPFPPNVTYVSWALEYGHSGTPHLQGVLQFSSRIRRPTIKKWLGSKIHLEPSQGVLAAALYTMKPVNYTNKTDKYQFGTPAFTQPCSRLMKKCLGPDPGWDYSDITYLLTQPIQAWTLNHFILHYCLTASKFGHEIYPNYVEYHFKCIATGEKCSYCTNH